MNVRKQPAAQITALYSRLSREDMLAGDSLSIQHQQQILETYAAQQGFKNIRHFYDDGNTGVRFERAGWKQLIGEVEAGNVAVLVTKDMSRLGREHVQVGMYMEMFRQRGVRFIAISNSIDSENPESLEFAPFINIMSEWFARDTSRKIKTVAHAKGNAGKRMSNNAIYGYRKSPEDRNIWLVDDEPAAVVRRIFKMALDGMGPYQIARKLTEDKVEKPSYYFAKNMMVGPKPSTRDLSEPYTWNGGAVSGILSKPEYCGHTVNFRTRKESYKDKNFKWNPKEEWRIFPNTHESIIDQQTFDTVQRLRGTPRRIDTLGEANPLTGIMFCHDCGAKMYNSRQSKEYYVERRFGKTYRHKCSDHYNCSSYELGVGAFKKVCSNHFVRTSVVRELVLDMIRRISGYVRENEAGFTERLREASTVRQTETAKARKRQISRNERRIAELDGLFRKVYEDNASGKLSDERYGQLSGAYELEQSGLKAQNAKFQAELETFSADSAKAGRFIEIVRRYTDFEVLTNAMLNEFVEKIMVHEADKSSGERVQHVDIYFNFIGNFDIPVEEAPPAPEEIEAREKRLKRLARQRIANQKWYAEQKRKSQMTPEEREAEELEKQARMAPVSEKRIKLREYKREWRRRRKERQQAEKPTA